MARGPKTIPTCKRDHDRQEGAERRVLSTEEMRVCGRGAEVDAFIDGLLGKDRADSLAMRDELKALRAGTGSCE